MSPPTESPGSFQGSFSQATWDRLLALGSVVPLVPGTALLRRGDPPGPLYVVLEGRLEVVDPRTSPPTTLTFCGPGEVLGELSFLVRRPASADVRVVEAGRCVRLDLPTVQQQLRGDPELDADLHRALSHLLAQRLGRLTSSAISGGFSSKPGALSAEDAPDSPRLDPHLEALLRGSEATPLTLARGGRLTIGSATRCDLVIDDPRVAALHAQIIDVPEEGFRIVGVHGNAIQVDGEWTLTAPLGEGAVVGLGRSRYRVASGVLIPLPRPAPFALHVHGVQRRIGPKVLLHHISFTALSGEVIAVIGPSGAGKSTLLSVLSGHVLPDAGTVRLGGEALAELVRRRPSTTAEVPQDDIVLPELTVEESLAFAARLRAPSADPQLVASQLIARLNLESSARSRIGDPERRGISGGQRKRVNIGTELVSPDTKVLFLDEPTSGLDPRSTMEIARLARSLADEGRIVVIVTHDLDPALLAEVDHLLVLTQGGRRAWYGPVAQACESFGVELPSQIFDRLPDRTPEAWEARYARSSMAAALADRDADPPRLHTPLFVGGARRQGWLGQLWTLMRRVARVKSRDPASAFVLVLQPALVGTVMLLVFPRGTAGLLFLLVLSCFWFGMSAAVRELISDRVVWQRERRIGVTASAWVLSKALVIGGLIALQAAALALVAHVGVGLGDLGYSLASFAGTAVLTGWVGVATGLLVSALWRRSEAAVGTIVLLLVPQITFAGLLMPLTDVTATAWYLAWLTPVRYAFQLILQTGDQLQYLKLGTWHTRPVSGELYLMGLRPAGEGGMGLDWRILTATLAGLILAQILAAILTTARRRA